MYEYFWVAAFFVAMDIRLFVVNLRYHRFMALLCFPEQEKEKMLASNYDYKDFRAWIKNSLFLK